MIRRETSAHRCCVEWTTCVDGPAFWRTSSRSQRLSTAPAPAAQQRTWTEALPPSLIAPPTPPRTAASAVVPEKRVVAAPAATSNAVGAGTNDQRTPIWQQESFPPKAGQGNKV